MPNPKEEFIAQLYPAARRTGRETGVSWELILAQAALETGWGQKVLPGTNNIFNIKADSGWSGESKSFKVPEFINGKRVQQDASFRVYDSVEDALRDRVQFLRDNPRYATAGLFDEGVKGSLRGEAAALQRAGYATDPNYAESLAEVFDGRTMRQGMQLASQRAGIAAQATHANVEAETAQRPPSPTAAATPAGHWPAPGNTTINVADKPGEGRGDFDTPRGGHRHGGIDIQGSVGDPIEPYAAGRVTRVVANNAAAGNMIEIDHGHGVVTRYMHLDRMNVKVGDQVTPETVIGTMGRSGNTPRQGDTHLHFELLNNGHRVNPLDHLQSSSRGHESLATPASQATTIGRRDTAHADGVIAFGNVGAGVENLQRSLALLGYHGKDGKPLATDGHFGVHTKAAVESFQRAHGLHVDGVAGDETLLAVTRAATCPLVSESTHPAHGVYAVIAGRLPAGTQPAAIANVTLQALENGMTTSDSIRSVHREGQDVFVMGTTPGYHVRVDLQAPTPSITAMSAHMAQQTQHEPQHLSQQQPQQSAPLQR